MARQYLVGDGNWSTAGNWLGDAPGVLPAVNDEVAIGPNLTNDVTDTTPAADDIQFDRLLVHRRYLKSFGTSGSPIISAFTHAKLYGAGPMFFDCDGFAAANKTDVLTIAAANPGVTVEIGGHSDPGDIDIIRALRGAILFKQSIQFGAGGHVECGWVNNQSGDAILTIDANAPTLPLLLVNGGNCFAKNQVTAMHICGGKVIKTDKLATTTYIYNGGTLQYDFQNTSTTVDIHVFAGGTLDLLNNEVPKTFGDIFIEKGANFLRDEAIHTFTLQDIRDEIL